MELKMIFYLVNVTNVVNISAKRLHRRRPSCTSSYISARRSDLGLLGRYIFPRSDSGSPACCKVRSRVRRAARRAQGKQPLCQEGGCQAAAIGECAREFYFYRKKTTHLVGVVLCRGRGAFRESREVRPCIVTSYRH